MFKINDLRIGQKLYILTPEYGPDYERSVQSLQITAIYLSAMPNLSFIETTVVKYSFSRYTLDTLHRMRCNSTLFFDEQQAYKVLGANRAAYFNKKERLAKDKLANDAANKARNKERTCNKAIADMKRSNDMKGKFVELYMGKGTWSKKYLCKGLGYTRDKKRTDSHLCLLLETTSNYDCPNRVLYNRQNKSWRFYDPTNPVKDEIARLTVELAKKQAELDKLAKEKAENK